MNVSSINKAKHDMRNCVNAILLNVEVLKDTVGETESGCYLKSIESESHKLDFLLRDMNPDHPPATVAFCTPRQAGGFDAFNRG
jgi:hypothetical protein